MVRHFYFLSKKVPMKKDQITIAATDMCSVIGETPKVNILSIIIPIIIVNQPASTSFRDLTMPAPSRKKEIGTRMKKTAEKKL